MQWEQKEGESSFDLGEGKIHGGRNFNLYSHNKKLPLVFMEGLLTLKNYSEYFKCIFI